ncbi:MAG: hypothetical protein VYE22_22545 [Myxococcota bacterium]|nr:hypothetical protein [Myxococcota bacterium]
MSPAQSLRRRERSRVTNPRWHASCCAGARGEHMQKHRLGYEAVALVILAFALASFGL